MLCEEIRELLDEHHEGRALIGAVAAVALLALPALLESGKKIDIAFIYMHKDADDYARIERKMTKLLDILVTAVGSKEDEQSASSL